MDIWQMGDYSLANAKGIFLPQYYPIISKHRRFILCIYHMSQKHVCPPDIKHGWLENSPKSIYPLVNIQKTMVLWNITMLSMDKSTIFMGLFQWQTVSLPEGILYIYPWFIHGCWLCSIIFHYWPLLTIGISIYGWFPRSSSSAIPSEPAAAQKLQWLRCQQRWRQRQRRVCRRQREV